MKKLAASFSALICLSIFLPLTTFAQGTQYDTFNTPNISPDGVIEGKGFIPCSGTTCSPCDLIVLFNTVLKWFLTISFLIFAIVALVAGIKLVTQGNPGALADAKKSFTNAFIGLIIILSAFLIVDTLMRYLVRDGGDIEGYGPWQKVACATQSEAKTEKGLFGGDVPYEQIIIPYDEASDNETSGFSNSGGTSLTPVSTANMTSLRSVGVSVANWSGINGSGRTDLVHPTVAQAVLRMQNNWRNTHNGSFPFQVTAAYTNNVGHSAGSQHYRGTAVDLQPQNANYDQIIQMCRQAGFTFINDERSAHHIHCDMR